MFRDDLVVLAVPHQHRPRVALDTGEVVERIQNGKPRYGEPMGEAPHAGEGRLQDQGTGLARQYPGNSTNNTPRPERPQ